jgi:hypothetical protein
MRAAASLVVLLFVLEACGKVTNDARRPPDNEVWPPYRGEIRAAYDTSCALSVSFWEYPFSDDTSDCTPEYGRCCYVDAPTSSPAGAFKTNASAGAVTVTLPVGFVRFEPGDDKSYEPEQGLPCKLGTLDVSAAGDEVHPFTGSVPIVASHDLWSLRDATAGIHRDQDYVLQWTPDPRPETRAVIELVGSPNQRGTIPVAWCSVADADGAVTFSAALLSRFPAGTAVDLETTRFVTTTVTTDNAVIDFTGTAATAFRLALR